MKAIRIAAVILTAGMATGCSTITVEQLDAVAATANNALAEARAAQETANNAMNVASEASYAATQAQQAAESAQACCDANKDRLDRMFTTAMQK